MILIVDDHVDNCDLLVQMLAHDGFDATCVHSGEAAIASLAAAVPALVVLDDFMPDMTGLDVIRQLRQNDRYAALRIVFYSAGADLMRRQAAKELGASAWFVKGQSPWAEAVGRIETLAGSGDARPPN